MKSPEEIQKIFREKNIDKGWSFAGCKRSETGKWTHGYHRYPAKFIPQLVEGLFDEYIQNGSAHINDPFCGSGTTIVTSISRGYRASGTDINKIAYLITKVKSTPIKPAYLDRQIKQIISKLTKKLPDTRPLIPKGHLGRIDRWFTVRGRNELGRILRIIYEEEDEILRNFFLVAFSNILKKCSVWMQGSTKPIRNLNKRFIKPLGAFERQLRRMQRGNTTFYMKVPSETRDNLSDYLSIEISDARTQPVPENSIDLIVSSSPYVTSYEYADLHQLSTIWLDLTDDLSEYRKGFIGTTHKIYEQRKPRSQLAADIVSKVSERSEKVAKEIEAFFIDIEEVFDESFRILKPGGRCCFVIGNTKLKGVGIKNAEVFAESLQYSGFEFDRLIKREIPMKTLPQKRDEKTGKFASRGSSDVEAYPIEYIVLGLKV